MRKFIEVPANKYRISNRKKVWGVGINNAPYMIINNGLTCPYVKVWIKMIERCLDPNGQECYKDCYVCKEWLTFMNFRHWMEKQDWETMYLDKDILVLGNKVYSPNTCVFVTNYVNSLFSLSAKNKSRRLPTGVYFSKRLNKYIVHCNVKPGAGKYLGVYSSLKEANEVYIKAKAQVLADEFKNISNVRIKNGLYKLILNLVKENNYKIKILSHK